MLGKKEMTPLEAAADQEHPSWAWNSATVRRDSAEVNWPITLDAEIMTKNHLAQQLERYEMYLWVNQSIGAHVGGVHPITYPVMPIQGFPGKSLSPPKCLMSSMAVWWPQCPRGHGFKFYHLIQAAHCQPLRTVFYRQPIEQGWLLGSMPYASIAGVDGHGLQRL